MKENTVIDIVLKNKHKVMTFDFVLRFINIKY